MGVYGINLFRRITRNSSGLEPFILALLTTGLIISALLKHVISSSSDCIGPASEFGNDLFLLPINLVPVTTPQHLLVCGTTSLLFSSKLKFR